MENYNQSVEKNGHAPEHSEQSQKEQCSSSLCVAMDRAKMMLAEKLENLSAMIGEKSTGRDEQSEWAACTGEASAILHQSAEYIREFDYDQAEAEVRGYIRQQPGRCLMIAGGLGLVLGLLLRRR